MITPWRNDAPTLSQPTMHLDGADAERTCTIVDRAAHTVIDFTYPFGLLGPLPVGTTALEARARTGKTLIVAPSLRATSPTGS